ncbi:S24 family peptidase [Luteolibacter pohnpeiensis]|uniref:S24 family peptidase n=1 Tax=Luteolibacter pohnpeiensis TaxID=454153 RepID=A0A934S4K0_9BACT|nr:S24 family peptidase [Luteolibacter pohnpeiensis]MBK1881009.1 S24 family peptidase [Luteolibacter pohnpeiensis]
MTKEDILVRMDQLGFTRQTLAEASGYAYEYVRDRLTPTASNPPKKFVAAVQRAFSEEERRREVDLSKPSASIWDLVFFNGAEVQKINLGRKAGGYEDIPSFYHDAIINFADELLRKEKEAGKTVKFPAKANLHAAAGSPIAAEVMDWEGENDTVMVKINGLSMVPLLNDGDVVPMRLKKTARNPYMKKGLIYLVDYDGGYTVKRYNTRKATPEEKEELGEWIERGKVKVLESLNPDFPEIVIKQPIEWIAWLD